jgi:hypothetical protein
LRRDRLSMLEEAVHHLVEGSIAADGDDQRA